MITNIFFIISVYLFSAVAIAAPDCSPDLRAKGLYQCVSKSHDGGTDRPRKVCTWEKSDKSCTCCIFNDAADEGDDQQEGFDRSHMEDKENPVEAE